MKKQLIFTAAVTLAISVLNSAAFASSINEKTNFPTIVGSSQSPNTKWSVVRHTFRIQVPDRSRPISQLKVSLPPGVTVKNDITVHDRANKNFTVNSNVSNDTVIIDFPQPIQSSGELEIDLNKVILSRVYSIPWSYRIKAKFADLDLETDIGVARIRNYLR
jgi:hypothetical protein